MDKDMVLPRHVDAVEPQPQIREERPCREADGRIVERGRAGALRLRPGQAKCRPDLDPLRRFDPAAQIGENRYPRVFCGFFCDAKSIFGVMTGNSFKTLVDYYQSHVESRQSGRGGIALFSAHRRKAPVSVALGLRTS